MKKSAASAPKTEGELELPDWSGMNDSSRRLSKEAALRLSEEYVMSGAAARNRRKELDEYVEFIL